MRIVRLSLLFCSLGLLAACSSSDEPGSTCGPGTTSQGGQCVSVVTCGANTELINNACRPVGGAAACGPGTVESGEECVPSEEVCAEGSNLIDGVCVAEGAPVCGSGTQLVGNACVVDQELVCGAGTESDDSGLCNPICTDGQYFDLGTGECVEACGEGTLLGVDSGVCETQCPDGQYFTDGACQDVPGCGRNTFYDPDDPNCEGWPFQPPTEEHPLEELLCSRRAFYICDDIFDTNEREDCGCEDAGDFFRNFLRDLDVEVLELPSISLGRDYEVCLATEYVECDDLMGTLRFLEERGEIAFDQAGLDALEAYSADQAGSCTRPVDYLLQPPFGPVYPVDLLADAFHGLVEEDAPCLSSVSCADGYCAYSEVEGGPLQICVPFLDEGDDCGASPEPVRDFVSSILGIAAPCDSSLQIVINDAGCSCEERLSSGSQCTDTSECREGAVCRANDPECDGIGIRTCGAPQNSGDCCEVPDSPFSAEPCGANLFCSDAANDIDSDGLGRCIVADDGGTPGDPTNCDFCAEVGGGASQGERAHTECQDGLACVLSGPDGDFEAHCQATMSVCPLHYADLWYDQYGNNCESADDCPEGSDCIIEGDEDFGYCYQAPYCVSDAIAVER